MVQRLATLILLLLVTIPSLAHAQDAGQSERLEQRAEEIVAAMRGEAVYDQVFADAFTNAVPETQFNAIQVQLESQFGPMIGVQTVEPVHPYGANIAIRFERGLAQGSFAIEPAAPFAVTGFRLSELRPIGDSAEQLLGDLDAVPGKVGVLVTRLGEHEPLLARNASQQFAIGSTFKLYVLSALTRSIATGERDWNDVVPLTARSFPSGQMHAWPVGSPVTLHTLATLMISISDNTATDQLIGILGRDAVEAEVVASGHSSPESTFPFLTTREMFLLKSGDEVDPAQYRAAEVAWRREALESLATIERPESAVLAAFTGGPNMIDLEWIASPTDLARAFRRIVESGDETALQILAIEPSLGPALKADWDYAGYKGGSEPGVLNLSWLLRDAAGEWTVVTLSWNDPDASVDHSALELLAMRAVALAGKP